MNMWTAIVLIVLISAFASVMRARYYGRDDTRTGLRREDRLRGMRNMAPSQPDPELQREVEALRKRLEVLERITTDERQSKSIAAEIESLRDK